jgi:tyrosyl-tRNA synthetase
MSFAELMYPLLQGWDWWKLYEKGSIQLQIGGSDQYGNIVAGMDAVNVIRRHTKLPKKKQETIETDVDDALFGITTPLLTTSSGEKFGKSAGNAIWLDKDMLSSYDLYQFFVRTADADVERYLRLFTFFPITRIREIMAEHLKDYSKRVAQHELAFQFVGLVHGIEEASEAQKQHRGLFGSSTQKLTLGKIREMIAESKMAMEEGKCAETTPPATSTQSARIPSILVNEGDFARILQAAGLAQSRGAAQRLINSGGAYVAAAATKSIDSAEIKDATEFVWSRITDDALGVAATYLIDGEILLLRTGKWNIRACLVIPEREVGLERS